MKINANIINTSAQYISDKQMPKSREEVIRLPEQIVFGKSPDGMDDQTGEPDPELLKAAVDAANRIAKLFNTNIVFEMHEETNVEMMRVVDSESGVVIREIPPREILDMIAKLWDTIGVFIDQKA